jgi:hypothetical protein
MAVADKKKFRNSPWHVLLEQKFVTSAENGVNVSYSLITPVGVLLSNLFGNYIRLAPPSASNSNFHNAQHYRTLSIFLLFCLADISTTLTAEGLFITRIRAQFTQLETIHHSTNTLVQSKLFSTLLEYKHFFDPRVTLRYKNDA